MHAGEVDILVGTQMVAKGHDFARLGLVGVLNADSMLFAHDFRAPERLFAQLMQVAGRAGRHQNNGEVLIQTGYPEQPVYHCCGTTTRASPATPWTNARAPACRPTPIRRC